MYIVFWWGWVLFLDNFFLSFLIVVMWDENCEFLMDYSLGGFFFVEILIVVFVGVNCLGCMMFVDCVCNLFRSVVL